MNHRKVRKIYMAVMLVTLGGSCCLLPFSVPH